MRHDVRKECYRTTKKRNTRPLTKVFPYQSFFGGSMWSMTRTFTGPVEVFSSSPSCSLSASPNVGAPCQLETVPLTRTSRAQTRP